MDSATGKASWPAEATRSAALHARAQSVLPSGNTRLTVYFAPYPIYAASGEGARITDVDGVERIDFINNYSSLIHGHRPPEVMAAIAAQFDRLVAVGLPTESEVALAEHLVGRLPAVDQVRFANSGTEAVMLAIKAARAFTGRPKIAKIEGAYHGGYDYAEVSQHSTPDNCGPADRPASTATSVGAPQGMLDDVVILPWNDVAAARALLREHGGSLAAILVDPMPSRLAYVPIAPDFLAMLRDTAAEIGALFILDEVYALRLGHRGSQGLLGISPDLTAMGKIIGGGLPVGAVGGSRAAMSVFAMDAGRPKVPHGGTYNANPMTMAAGLAAMTLYDAAAVDRINALGERMREGLRRALRDSGSPGQVMGAGSLCLLTLYDGPIRSSRDLFAAAVAGPAQVALHAGLMARGIFTTPNLLFTLSTAMTEDDIDFAIAQVRASL